MLLIPILILGILALWWWPWRDSKGDPLLERISVTFVCAFFGTFVLAIVMMCVGIGFDAYSGQHVVLARHESPILSMSNSKDIHGNFFLGSGTINSEERYYFMYDLGDGKSTRGSVSTAGTIIQESDTLKPTFIREDCVRKSLKAEFWITDFFTFERKYERGHTLIVPKGTVIQKFEVR